MINKPKVIILAAGEGKRLRPYTADRPKCLVEINDVSLIDRQIKILKTEGLDNIIMIGGYKAEMLKKKNIKMRINSKYYETNMAWTLFTAEEELNDDIIISYGDIVYSKEILRALINSNYDISVTIDKDWKKYWSARSENPLDDAETLKLKNDGKIYEIGKKPSSFAEIEGQYMGLMKFSVKGINHLKKLWNDNLKKNVLFSKPLKKVFMTDVIQALIDSGLHVHSIPVFGGWVEVDTVEDLKSPITLQRINSIK